MNTQNEQPQKEQIIRIERGPDTTSIHIRDQWPDGSHYTWTLQSIENDTLQALYDKLGKIINPTL